MPAPRVVVIIQSRLGSARFPNKALADINGRPMIQHVVDRARCIEGVDEVCIATVPTHAEGFKEFGVRVYAPAIDENDVLARFAWVKTRLGASMVVRITGDCPMFDPEEASKMIEHMQLGVPGDYMTNRTAFNDGLDVEVVTAKALHRADDEATSAYDREHVTSYIYTHGEVERGPLGFPIPTGFQPFVLRRYEGHRITNGEKWSVDTVADLELVRTRMAEHAYANS